MAKLNIIACVLAVVCAVSCGKEDDKLSGTQWQTTIQQIYVLLSFTNESDGVLTVTNLAEEGNERITFTYTYTKPDLLLRPNDPPYITDFPDGIKTVVHGKVMDFSRFAEKYFPGIDITLTKK